MAYEKAVTHFEQITRETKIIGDKSEYRFWLFIFSVFVFPPACIILGLINFYAGLIIFLLLLFGYYLPSIDKSMREAVGLQDMALVTAFNKLILFVKPASGLLWIFWPLRMIKIKTHVLAMNFPAISETNPDPLVWTALKPTYEEPGEEKIYENDYFHRMRLPLRFSGSLQVEPLNPIKVFQKIIDLDEYETVRKRGNREIVEAFFRNELGKQVYPEINNTFAEIIPKMTPAQVFRKIDLIREKSEIGLIKRLDDWGFGVVKFQIAMPQLLEEISKILTEIGAALAAKEITVIEALGRRITIREEQFAWAEGMKKLRDEVGEEFFKVFKDPETRQKMSGDFMEGLKGGKTNLVMSENPLGQFAAMLSPSLGEAFRKFGGPEQAGK